MKKFFFILYLATVSNLAAFSQMNISVSGGVEDEHIQQIRTSGLSDILSFQMQNQGISNVTVNRQIGDWNKSVVNQQYDGGSAYANQVHSIQQGSSNEMTIGQIGNGNLLLGFQIGYLASELDGLKGNQLKSITEINTPKVEDLTIKAGTGNELKVIQQGEKNAIVAIQQGSDNSIEADQNGVNNYLVIYQKGNDNEVVGFKQENNSTKVLAETIIQEGEGLVLNSTDASKSKPNGNSFIQKGINLSIELNNQFANALGGIEVSQSGKDMKVIIDQSFFPLLTK